MKMEVNSATKMVEKLILEKVTDEPMERKLIVEYIHSQIEDEVSDGIIAGGFKSLVRRHDLEVVGRGFYKKVTGNSTNSTFTKIYNLCDKFKADLEKHCTVNLLGMNTAERQNCIRYLDVLEKGNAFINSYMLELQEVMDIINSGESAETATTE